MPLSVSIGGGLQILYAGIKFPFLMLLTAAICTPVLTTLNVALDRPAHLQRDLALVLGALATGSLALFAQVPLIFLAIRFDASYHQVILLAVCCSTVAGATSLALLYRGIGLASRDYAKLTATALVVVVAIVGAQLAWTLRPYAIRPRTPDIPFLRNIEGNLIEAVTQTANSARGIYSRESAPLPSANQVAP